MKSHSIVGPLLLGVTQALASPSLSSFVKSRSSSLTWKTCDLDLPDGIKDAMREPGDCATLEVPLDYTNKDSGKTIELQLIRFNATKEPFKGSVLWNPGGPGISGIETLAYLGPDFRDILGGHHHIISWDTRGTGKTIPFACDKTATSTKSRRSEKSLPQAELWPYITNEKWENMTALADACYASQQEYGRYISTAFTARDIMQIVDALDEDGKLQYWGISYGTILGQVVASLFPDRVGRILLDSNSLADAYLSSTGIGGSRDAEKSLNYFLSECVEVGTELCRLANYSGPDTTAQDLRSAVDDLFEKLIDEELPADSGLTYRVPPRRQLYPAEAQVRHPQRPCMALDISHRCGDPGLRARRQLQEGSQSLLGGPLRVEPRHRGILWHRMLGFLLPLESADELYSMYRAHLAESTFGDAIAADYMGCSVWRFTAAEGVNTNELRNVNTSYPILVVNGAYDPVTSLTHAWQVSSRFRGSRMLVHEGIGHGVTSHASNCTLDAIAAYFQEGALPEVGTVCKPNMLAFEYSKWLQEQA